MKVLITGACGFIGSHLMERLLLSGHKVTILDRYTKGKEKRLQNLSRKQFSIRWVDITTSPSGWTRYFRGIDWVFHMAGCQNTPENRAHPIRFHDVNATGTLHVLEAARKGGVNKFIYPASASYYVYEASKPANETAILVPRNPYAVSKYLGEMYTLHWGKVYKLPVVSMRIFNPYGPKSTLSDSYGPILTTFLNQKFHEKTYTVYGDGNQMRDFIHITDVVEALILAAKSDISGEVFNVGSGTPHTISEFVSLLGGKVRYLPMREGEVKCMWADIRKINKMLGWKPKVSFEDGIKRVLKIL